MTKEIKTGLASPGPKVAVNMTRHVDTGDPWVEEAGKATGQFKSPPKKGGDPWIDSVTASQTQLHVPDLHRGEDDEDEKKKRAEEKAEAAQLRGDAMGEQADHFIKDFPAPDDNSPPRPNERAGLANRRMRG